MAEGRKFLSSVGLLIGREVSSRRWQSRLREVGWRDIRLAGAFHTGSWYLGGSCGGESCLNQLLHGVTRCCAGVWSPTDLGCNPVSATLQLCGPRALSDKDKTQTYLKGCRKCLTNVKTLYPSGSTVQ